MKKGEPESNFEFRSIFDFFDPKGKLTKVKTNGSE